MVLGETYCKEMGQMRKKWFVVLLFSLISVLFAFRAFASTSFMLAHAVNVPLNYALSFRGYTELGVKGEGITDYEFDGDGRYLFASLYLTFNRTMMFDNITVSFTDLQNTDDRTDCYPYVMEVLVPGDDTNHLVEIEESGNGCGAGSAKIVASSTAFKRTTTDPSEDRRLADFAITLSGGDGNYSGTYIGTITLDFVAN